MCNYMEPAPLTDVELAAWRGMLVTHARVTQQLDAQMRAAHGMSVSGYEVLLFLIEAPGHRLRMAQIADEVLLSRSGCTRLVDRLARLGYVTRTAADGDGRGLFAELTRAGVEMARAARVTHRAGIRRYFLDALDDADDRALATAWRKLETGAPETQAATRAS
jgi:DNA-binding MarR family transcriptional regulator